MNANTTGRWAACAALLLMFGQASMAQDSASSSASSEAKPGNDCVFSRTPSDWRVLDDRHLILWAPSRKDAYLVELFSPLPGLPFAETVGFVDDDNNGMICGYGGDKVTTPDSSASTWPSTIQSMRRVDEAELIALGEKYKVKLVNPVKKHDKKIH